MSLATSALELAVLLEDVERFLDAAQDELHGPATRDQQVAECGLDFLDLSGIGVLQHVVDVVEVEKRDTLALDELADPFPGFVFLQRLVGVVSERLERRVAQLGKRARCRRQHADEGASGRVIAFELSKSTKASSTRWIALLLGPRFPKSFCGRDSIIIIFNRLYSYTGCKCQQLHCVCRSLSKFK
jgi:hypothetical protein